MEPFGQYGTPSHVVAHVSDTHLLAGDRLQYGAIDTVANLERALTRLTHLDPPPQAIVFTGDLADLGEPDAYRQLRKSVEPVAARLGARIVWCMGNHDDRAAYARELLDAETDGGPQDAVHDVDGLRIIALDTTVPGWHHGEVDDRQLEWLAGVLAEPAPHGSILAVHHPPIPVPMVPAAQIIELLDQSRLAAVLEGSDVRAILGGHFHFSSHSLFAGIPVSVAAATCYTLDPAPLDRLVSSTDGHQAVNVVHVYGDRLVHSVVPVAQAPEIHGYPAEVTALLEAMTPAERREMFSRKGSDFNTADAAWSGGS